MSVTRIRPTRETILTTEIIIKPPGGWSKHNF